MADREGQLATGMCPLVNEDIPVVLVLFIESDPLDNVLPHIGRLVHRSQRFPVLPDEGHEHETANESVCFHIPCGPLIKFCLSMVILPETTSEK